MIVTIDHGELASALKTIGRVVEKRDTIPILSNALLTVENGTLKIAGTNQDIEARCIIVGAVVNDESGPPAITADFATLEALVSRYSDRHHLRLEWSEKSPDLLVSWGRSKSKVRTLPADMLLPAFARFDPSIVFEVNGELFAKMLARTVFCIAREETMVNFSGVHVFVRAAVPVGYEIAALGVDGHRMALSCEPCPVGAELMPRIAIARKVVDVLSPLLRKSERTNMAIGEKWASWEFDARVIVTARIMDLELPPYARALEGERQASFLCEAEELRSAVDRCLVVKRDSKLGSDLIWDFVGSTVSIMSRDMNAGEVSEEVAGELTGDLVHVHLNGRYVSELLAAAEADTMRIETSPFGGSGQALGTVFSPEGNPGVKWVVMPMKGAGNRG